MEPGRIHRLMMGISVAADLSLTVSKKHFGGFESLCIPRFLGYIYAFQTCSHLFRPLFPLRQSALTDPQLPHYRLHDKSLKSLRQFLQ